MFTKQHYKAIAHILDANHTDLCVVSDFADYFEEDNERFDRTLFIRAATEQAIKDMRHQERMLKRERVE